MKEAFKNCITDVRQADSSLITSMLQPFQPISCTNSKLHRFQVESFMHLNTWTRSPGLKVLEEFPQMRLVLHYRDWDNFDGKTLKSKTLQNVILQPKPSKLKCFVCLFLSTQKKKKIIIILDTTVLCMEPLCMKVMYIRAWEYIYNLLQFTMARWPFILIECTILSCVTVYL